MDYAPAVSTLKRDHKTVSPALEALAARAGTVLNVPQSAAGVSETRVLILPQAAAETQAGVIMHAPAAAAGEAAATAEAAEAVTALITEERNRAAGVEALL